MSSLANRYFAHPFVGVIVFLSILAAETLHAEESTLLQLGSRVKMIPQSPLHGGATDGGILSANQHRLVTVGKNYYEQHQYLSIIKLPTGEVLAKVAIESPIEEIQHAAGSLDGSRIAILQGNKIEIRDVIAPREVKHRFPAKAGEFASLALSNDGAQLAVGSFRDITVYDCENGKRLQQFKMSAGGPIVFYSDVDQLGFFGSTGVWLSESSGEPPELLVDTLEGFEMQNACISNGHCFASLKKKRSGNLAVEILSGKYEDSKYLVAKFDIQGNVMWQVGTSDDLIAVSHDTVVFCNQDLLMRTTDSADVTTIGRCEWLRQLKFSAGGEILAGVVKDETGVQVWNAKTWRPHFANAIPYGPSASGIDDNGRAIVTSQSSVCFADLGKPFQRMTDLPDDISPFLGKHWLSGDGRLLAWLTKSDGVKLMDLTKEKEIEIETRSDLRATSVWINQPGDRVIVRYKSKPTSPGQEAKRSFFAGFFGGSSTVTTPTDLISLPAGERYAEFNTSDLEMFMHPIFPGERMTYSTSTGIAHYTIGPTSVNKTGHIPVKHYRQSVSSSGAMVVGTWSGKVLWYENPMSSPQTILQTNDDHKLIVSVSPDGQTAYCCEYVSEQRQTLLKVIRCPDAKILWEQWLPGEISQIHVSPQGEYLLLSMYDGWFVVDTK
ncbi:secreted protein [Rhodopirellula maiorica SM1]|uniref:Secreted protein n=1 Tax=Rhodopirellula maiorica SM1 TaxID=1265738 RepID=M5RJG5_9BACT|nr:hypothetical protein [Rhodopirellula maiorica]EMI15522.1 secreted protein [Rhodopirellula maiorica SM1]